MAKKLTAQPDDTGRSPRLVDQRVSRRGLFKASALLGGTALLAQATDTLLQSSAEAAGEYPLDAAENMIFTACQQCNTQCGIKVKLLDGVPVKIDGNPYSPMTLHPHLPYATPFAQAMPVDAAICPKGQAGIQSAYDPYRLRTVLKRKPGTMRGANAWVSVPFAQAVREIVDGGDLFGEGPISGLDELWAIRDPKLLSEIGAFITKILGEKDPEKKQALVAEFQTTYKDQLDKLIDPQHPDLGPKNNQISVMWGRLKGGRGELLRRFFTSGLGTVNTHGHTTVCQGSLYFSGKAMSEQFAEGKFTGGEKFYWQAELGHSEYVIFVGASPFEGNYGPPFRANKITEGLATGRLKYVVIDPRLSRTASKASQWIPVKPGSDGAIAMAMIRWIIEQERYDAAYLRAANKAAALAVGEPTWTNSVWLVKLDKAGVPGAFLRAAEIGLTKKSEVDKEGKKVAVYTTADGTELTYDLLVALVDGKPVAFDPNSDKEGPVGDLFVQTALTASDGTAIPVKSGMQILKESAERMTIEQYAAEATIDPAVIVELAREFTSHGKRAVTDIHRGVSQHTNGFYNVVAWYTLNLLIGNYDWQGGLIKASAYDAVGGKAGQPYPLATLDPGKLTPCGINVIRHSQKWQDTTLYDGNYPARRNWYPLSSDIYQEQIPSMGDAYPYQVKALFIYMGTPVYSLPAGNTNIEILKDPSKIPLVIASDIVVGETSMYADYIFPDLTYLERWEFGGSHPSVPWKIQPLRQPAIAPLVETVTVYGQETALSVEALFLGLAEALQLPNFGPNGLGEGQPLTHPDHYYLRMVANLAFGEKEDGSDAVADATDEELRVFAEARRHLPKSVFDLERWRASVGESLWRKAVAVLNRGGRFQDYAKAYEAEQVKNRYGKQINLYQEKTATTKSAMTGKPLIGYAAYVPAPLDVLGNPIKDEEAGYALHLITYRDIFHTKSRTVSNYWLLALAPENHIVMNAQDAVALGLQDGDEVRVSSATNTDGVWDLGNGQTKPIVGKLKVLQGMRPGVVAFSLGHGHWAYGASDIVIDGQTIPGDPRRATGVHANAAMRIDPYLKNTCLVDPVGGSAVFYDTRVKVEKAAP